MTWKEITTSGDYKNLPDSLRSDIKRTYFQSNIAPGLADASPEDVNLAFQDWMQTPDDTGEGLARSMLGSAARGFLDPLAAVPEVAGAYTGIESLEELGGDIRSGIESTFPVNPAQQGILTDVAGVAGQVGQIAATGGLGAASGIGLAGKAATKAAQLRAASLGAKAAQQGAMGASAVAGGLERAEQLGLDDNERLIRGLLAGGTELATEKLGGFATELGPINKLLGQSAEEQWFKPVIRGILTEAGEEGAAETAGQATDIAMSDNAPEMDLKQIGYAMLLGGAGGAMFGGVEAAIAPRTAQAYKDSGAFVPVRSTADIPADIDATDDANLVYDSKDNLIGYKPKSTEVTVETELPYEAPIEINVDEQLPEPVRAEVEAMVANVDETPETSATAAALAEDAGAIAAEVAVTEPEVLAPEKEADATNRTLNYQGNELPYTVNVAQADDGGYKVTGIKVQLGNGFYERIPFPQDKQSSFASADEARAAADQFVQSSSGSVLPQTQEQPALNQPAQDVPLTQEALQQEQSSVEALPQPRELPILPEEPTAQAPEVAVGADAAELEQQWQDSPQFAAAEEAAAAGDMERADAIEAEWREQQKVTKDVAESGGVVDGGVVRKQQDISNEEKQQEADAATSGNLEDQSAESVSSRNIKSGGKVAAREQWAISELTTRATRDSTQSGPTLPPSATESPETIEATLESLRKEFDSKSQDFRNSVIDFYSDTSNAKTSNQAQSPPQSPLGQETGLSPADAVKATESTGVGVSNVDDSVLSQWTEGKQPNGWVNVKSEYGEWSSTRKGVGWWIQAIPLNVGKGGKKIIKNVVFAPSGEISNAKSFDGDKSLKELQYAAESVENASRKRQGKPLLKQVSSAPTDAVPTESLEGQLPKVSPEPTGAVPTESLPAGQPMSGDMGAAVARDATKPEQMTPEEFKLPKSDRTPSSGKKTAHKGFVLQAVAKNKPVSAEAVDNYGIKLPEGYTRQGDLYAFNATPPTPQQQQPATPATQEAQPEAAAFATQQPATEAQQPVSIPDLIAGLERWKGDNSDLLIHIGDELSNAPTPKSASGASLRSQARAIVNALSTAKLNPIKLYRGGKRSPQGIQELTSSKKVAEKWAKQYGGTVHEIPANSVPAIEISSIIESEADAVEKGWLVDNDFQTQQPAEETGDAGVTSASERLRADIATLPAKAQAAWTPELLAIADSYYQSGDRDLLYKLNESQRKRVRANAASDAEKDAYAAEQKRQKALRNPPAATYADAANDPNVFVDSLSEAELQQGIEMREKSPEPRKSLLRQNDGSVIRTGVTPRAAEAARNSYTGVIPGVEQTWMGTVAEFQEQHPDGIDWGNGKMLQPDADVEAGVAADGRSYVFIDRVQLLEGDVKRAEQYGTTPQGEAVKRLLRHESFGHRGAMSLPAPLRNRFVDMIASGVIPEAELDYIVNERGYSNYAGWRDNIAKQIMLGEEWLAHKMEGIRAIPQSGPMAQMMDWLRDVWAWLTGAERAMLPELRDMMREMHRALGALRPEQRVVGATRASLQQSPLDAEYLAAASKGDSGSDNLIQLLRDASESERKAVVDAWVQRNPKAAAEMQRMVDEAARGAGIPWLGVVDLRDGHVIETHSMSKARANDFHHSFTISQKALLSERAGDARVFWIEGGEPESMEGLPANIKKQIRDQLKGKLFSHYPVTYDSSGAIIPLSQRFQSTSNDIRYSRQNIRNQPAPLTSPETKNTAPNSAIRSIAEMQAGLDGVMEVLPLKYHPLAKKGGAQDALKAYADDLLKPYIGSIETLRKLLSIVKDDALLSSELGIGARSGSVVMASLLNKAADRASQLGNDILSRAFMQVQGAFASSSGQNQWSNKAVKMDTEFSGNYVRVALDETDINSVKKTVDPLINTKDDRTVNDTLDNAKLAGDEAADAVAEALEDEAMISMRVLELGALAQEDAELRGLLEELIAITIDLGELADAEVGRASIAGRRTPLKFANAAERDAAIEKLKSRQTEVLAAIKAKIAKPKKPKEPKTEAATKEPKAPKEKQPAKEKEAKPVQTAKQIINKIISAAQRKEKKPADIDKVRELYKLDLKKPMDEADFVAKAKEAGLDAALAVELKDAIDLELIAIAIEAEFRAAEKKQDKEVRTLESEMAKMLRTRSKFLDIDSSALAAFVNKLRTNGQLKGTDAIKWADILSLPVADQETVKANLLERVSKHEVLKNLTPAQQEALADALDAVWQRERRKIFKRMIKRADMKGVDKATQEKIANATPALLKFINQGMLGSDAFYLALGEQFNIQRISKEDRAKVEQLAAEMQAPDVTTMERTIKSEQIAKILQKNSTMSYAELASSVWVVHVLTGGATLLDMGLGFMTGALSVIKKAINVAAIGKPGLALEGLSDFGRFLYIAGKEAVGNVVRPESGILAAKEASMMAYMQKGALGAGLTPGDRLQLIRDEPGDSAAVKANKKIQRALGRWLSMWERIMGGLDHFNSVATTHGTMRLAAALNPKLYDEALIPSQQDYKNMLARAKAKMPDGTPKAQSALARSMIYDGIHLLGKGLEEGKMEQWRNMVFDIRGEGFTASFQEDPSGLGGILYNGIKSMTDGLEVKTREFRDKQREKFKETRGVGPATLINRAAGEMGYVLAIQAQNIMGSRFIRFTGNKLNELISYTPFIGLARLQEEGMKRDGLTNLRAKNIYHNQALSIVALTAYMYMMQRLDDDEEEKNVIVEGSWDNLTPARKSQLMSDGFKPNTIRFKMSNGQWVSGNFTSWPFAGWLAAFGTVSDYKRYTPDKWTEKEAMDKTMLALYSGAFAITDISSLSQLMEMFGKSTYSTDPVKTANERFVKGTTSFLGGFFPRIVKDIDSWFDHTAYKPKDTWEHLAKEVPYLRRSAGAPIRDIFYEKVEVTRSPWSRAIKVSPDDPAYQKLARLNSRGIWLTPPNPENRKVRRGGVTRALTEDEAAAYMSETGAKYKEFIMKRGDMLAKMDADRAAELIEKTTARIREIALKRAIARGGKAVTIEAE